MSTIQFCNHICTYIIKYKCKIVLWKCCFWLLILSPSLMILQTVFHILQHLYYCYFLMFEYYFITTSYTKINALNIKIIALAGHTSLDLHKTHISSTIYHGTHMASMTCAYSVNGSSYFSCTLLFISFFQSQNWISNVWLCLSTAPSIPLPAANAANNWLPDK